MVGNMTDNIANKEDMVLDAIIMAFFCVVLLLFVVSFGGFVYNLILWR